MTQWRRLRGASKKKTPKKKHGKAKKKTPAKKPTDKGKERVYTYVDDDETDDDDDVQFVGRGSRDEASSSNARS